MRSFRLGNHRSFRDEHELLLMPVYSKDRLVLPVAAIYGANASGKSSLLNGLRFMAEAVRDSHAFSKPDRGLRRQPFKLDRAARNRPSVFVVELVLKGIRYTYGFEMDDQRVVAEWLYSYPEKKRRVLFERDGDRFKLGGTLEHRSTWKAVIDLLRPQALLLSIAGPSKITTFSVVYEWFTRHLQFCSDVGASVDENALVDFLQLGVKQRDELLALVRTADIGISDVVLVEEGLGPDRQTRVGIRHGSGAELFGLPEESAGTLSWLGLLPTVLTVLDQGGTLVIDEIDTSLHPRLTASLVALFRDEAVNMREAQLIFSTHDASLLSPVMGEEVLTREDVWFVQKNDEGASELYALSDFKPRKEGENLERRYLGGSYGAIPNVFAEDLVHALRGADGAA